MTRISALLISLLFVLPAVAQYRTVKLDPLTISQLTAAGNPGKTAVITDGVTPCDATTGGGTYTVLVVDNGTSWQAVVGCSNGSGVSSLNSLSGALSLTSTGSTVAITPSGTSIDLEVPVAVLLAPSGNQTITGGYLLSNSGGFTGPLNGTLGATTPASIVGTTIQANTGFKLGSVTATAYQGIGANILTCTGAIVAGDALTVDSNGTCIDSGLTPGGGGGGGSVTSVGLSMPAQYAVANSPVTGSDTLTVTWNTETANHVLAGPASGAAAAPTFRALVSADIPNNAANTTGTAANVTGTVAIANGGTGQTTQQAAINALTGSQTSGYYLRSNGTNATLSAIQAADVPTLNQNTTGTAANITATSNSTLTTLSSLALPYSQLSGAVPTWNQSTTGNAATATTAIALASSPAQCVSGKWATGIAANGNANCSTPTGAGTVTSFSAGNLTPLFTTSVTNATSTPALSFTQNVVGGGTVFGNYTPSNSVPSFTSNPQLGLAGTSTGTILLANSTGSGIITLAPTIGGGIAATVTIQDSTDTLVGRATTDTLTNKTLSSATLTGTNTVASGASLAPTGSGTITATSFPATPTQCSADQFATGVAANGNANCTSFGGGVSTKTASYLAVAGDSGKLIRMNCSSCTLTLPATAPGLPWNIAVININATALTVSPNSLDLNGSTSSITVVPSGSLYINTDGTNYFSPTPLASVAYTGLAANLATVTYAGLSSLTPVAGSVVFCTDCQGPQDSATWGSTALGSGTGSMLVYETNTPAWRVH